VDSGDPGAGELWDARERLWQRLLACELTEVYVASDLGLTTVLPQTLGLEPISFAAYYYDRDGAPISEARRARIARELAAQRFWIVDGGWPSYWDDSFAERAQIAIILLKPPWYRRLSRVLALFLRTARGYLPTRRDRDDGGGSAYEGIASQVKHDTTQAEFYKRVQTYRPSGPSRVSSPMSAPPRTTTRTGQFLLERYPEKTIVVSTMPELRQLQALRIRRAWPDAASTHWAPTTDGEPSAGPEGRLDQAAH
jgi:hypothetical protein